MILCLQVRPVVADPQRLLEIYLFSSFDSASKKFSQHGGGLFGSIAKRA